MCSFPHVHLLVLLLLLLFLVISPSLASTASPPDPAADEAGALSESDVANVLSDDELEAIGASELDSKLLNSARSLNKQSTQFNQTINTHSSLPTITTTLQPVPSPSVLSHAISDSVAPEEFESPSSILKHSSMFAPPSKAFESSGTFTTPALTNIIHARYAHELEEEHMMLDSREAEDSDLARELGEEVEPPCPLTKGTYQQYRRFGHRLLYEGNFKLAHVCFKQAVKFYLNPMGEVEPTHQVSMHQQFQHIFPESHAFNEQSFADFAHVVDLIQERTERLYALPWQPIRQKVHQRIVQERREAFQLKQQQMLAKHQNSKQQP